MPLALEVMALATIPLTGSRSRGLLSFLLARMILLSLGRDERNVKRDEKCTGTNFFQKSTPAYDRIQKENASFNPSSIKSSLAADARTNETSDVGACGADLHAR